MLVKVATDVKDYPPGMNYHIQEDKNDDMETLSVLPALCQGNQTVTGDVCNIHEVLHEKALSKAFISRHGDFIK